MYTALTPLLKLAMNHKINLIYVSGYYILFYGEGIKMTKTSAIEFCIFLLCCYY